METLTKPLVSKTGIVCYDGPPLWFLPPHFRLLVSKMPETRKNLVSVRVFFTDKRYYDTGVALDYLIEIPEPYTVRDIAKIAQLV